MGGEVIRAVANPGGKAILFGVAVNYVERFFHADNRPGERENIQVEGGEVEMPHPVDMVKDSRFFYYLSRRLGVKDVDVVAFLAESRSQVMYRELAAAFEARPGRGIDCEADSHEQTGKN